MSYTELYYITPKKRVVMVEEYKNSHRGAMLVWANLWEAHCKERIEEIKKTMGFTPFTPVEDRDWQLLWALFRNPEISEVERAILGSTFDNVILKKEHFQRFYDDVLKYAEYYPAGSLIRQAQFILGLSKKNIIGVMWNQTSVNGDGYDNIRESLQNGEAWSLYKEVDKYKKEAE